MNYEKIVFQYKFEVSEPQKLNLSDDDFEQLKFHINTAKDKVEESMRFDTSQLFRNNKTEIEKILKEKFDEIKNLYAKNLSEGLISINIDEVNNVLNNLKINVLPVENNTSTGLNDLMKRIKVEKAKPLDETKMEQLYREAIKIINNEKKSPGFSQIMAANIAR